MSNGKDSIARSCQVDLTLRDYRAVDITLWDSFTLNSPLFGNDSPGVLRACDEVHRFCKLATKCTGSVSLRQSAQVL
jgi:hypothetical protein